ncbi:MAG: sigma-70 family RNA polymerase sigma factor [Lachnospiraceae bacterium]|nr:sigma-70 family RNA polymerase sigma factor [Lachnospiraceae bacterium]
MQDKKASIRFIERSYRLYEQKMYQVAYSILHDSGLAEDAVSEAFLKLMKHNIYFEDPKSDDCKRYIISVIKHASINIYNKKKREQEIMYLTDEDMNTKDLSNRNPADPDIDIEELISDLPSKYYATVYYLTVENLSVKETAAKLGITEAAVRKRFERAKFLLKTIMKGREQNEAGNQLHQSNIS